MQSPAGRQGTGSHEQFTSYTAHVDYYTGYIKSNPNWEFVDVYTDEGISGVSTKNRDGFNQMISDALAGRIDLIVTKSVSRFARNTVDSLTTVRKLKEKGVEVYFEEEDTYTKVSFNNTIYCGYCLLSLTIYRISFSIFKRLLIGLSDK